MSTLTCNSPIDGTVFATRETLAKEAAKEAIKRAKAAQSKWAARPLQDRIDLVLAGVAAVGAINDDIVPELAKMMGRPIRYGGEFGGFNERATHMALSAPNELTHAPWRRHSWSENFCEPPESFCEPPGGALPERGVKSALKTLRPRGEGARCPPCDA